jgi:hypothetical protein
VTGSKRWLVPTLGLLVVAFGVWLLVFNRGPAAAPGPGPVSAPVAVAAAQASEPRATADRVVAAIRAHDGAALAALVHPDGVRLSPSAFVDIEADQRLSPSAVAALWTDATPQVWGVAEASGDPIELTPAAYVGRYILDHDYANATVSVNGDTSRGTTVDNAASVYPGATRIEYFREGADATDWSALRLVLVPVGGDWRLVGIIHDEWTP